MSGDEANVVALLTQISGDLGEIKGQIPSLKEAAEKAHAAAEDGLKEARENKEDLQKLTGRFESIEARMRQVSEKKHLIHHDWIDKMIKAEEDAEKDKKSFIDQVKTIGITKALSIAIPAMVAGAFATIDKLWHKILHFFSNIGG